MILLLNQIIPYILDATLLKKIKTNQSVRLEMKKDNKILIEKEATKTWTLLSGKIDK